ncbi:hypothetical protein KCU98_g14617, partial [Aureobasidium melanogenum]
MSQNNKFMTIKRSVRDKYGNVEEQTETITNPRVIAAYKKRKLLARSQAIDIMNTKATGDEDFDALQKQLMQAEIERLERNMGRRQARERAKGDGADGADAATPAPTGKGKGRSKKNTEGTARKCANCGQVGHIKTNKKLCPMLNGTMKQEDMAVTGFGGGPGPGAAGAGPGGETSSFGALPA